MNRKTDNFLHVRKGVMVLILALTIQSARGQILPYTDSTLSIEQRVNDLLNRMTPEEKFRQLFMVPGDLTLGREKLKAGLFGLQIATRSLSGDQTEQVMHYDGGGEAARVAAEINEMQRFFREETRLGIPIIPFDEALHGLVRDGATAFPQAIALAATFDTALMNQVAGAIAAESASRGLRMILSPVVNLARDVRWGRTEETYGEDPFLTTTMGTLYVKQMRKAGLITTPKHFAVNTGEGGRDSYPAHQGSRILDEMYLKAFKACLIEAKSTSVMTAYNSLDGSPCSANSWLLNEKLKGEWAFDGFVISDANAVGGANVLHYTAKDYAEAGAKAIQNGLDVIFQTDLEHERLFIPPFLDGTISQKTLDEAVSRVLRAKFALGLFDHYQVDTSKASAINGCARHRAIALEAAHKSIVLLKNDNLLPVSSNYKRIAIIGTDAAEARLGGYSGSGNHIINLLDGMRMMAGESAEIRYSPGCGRDESDFEVITQSVLYQSQQDTSRTGITTEFFDNPHLSGTPVASRHDATIHFRWTLLPPCKGVDFDWYSVRCTTWLAVDQSGEYEIGVEGNDGYRLWFDDSVRLDNWEKRSYSTKTFKINLQQGESHRLKFEYHETAGSARIKLLWKKPGRPLWQRAIDQAVAVASQSDLVIANVGINEGEGLDRAQLSLPGHQEEMLHALAATGKPLVVVITGGSAVVMNGWVHKARAIVETWYAGEAGGEAIASVLLGRINPGGRLPITFPITEGQLPLVYNHLPTGRNDDYGNLTGKPLFPFGYGLSYTTFGYSNLTIDKPLFSSRDTVSIRFTLTNTGSLAGEEVAQLYVKDLLASVARPVTELKGFARIALAPGESKEVVFNLTPAMLQMLNKDYQWVTEPGEFRIMIGASSVDIKLRGKITYTQLSHKQ